MNISINRKKILAVFALLAIASFGLLYQVASYTEPRELYTQGQTSNLQLGETWKDSLLLILRNNSTNNDGISGNLNTLDNTDTNALQDTPIDDDVFSQHTQKGDSPAKRWGDEYVPFENILTEEEALTFPPCNDMKSVADPSQSLVQLLEPKPIYKIGDCIRLKITLFNYGGQPKTSGGDIIKVVIRNPARYAFSPGAVVDKRNGTYIAEVDVLWGGAAQIFVSLVYTREAITAYYSMRRKMLSTQHIDAYFSSRTFNEQTSCHPDMQHLINYTNNTEVCNMTYINSGMPWYCNKPKNIHLLCEDWRELRVDKRPPIPLTTTELSLIKSRRVNISKPIDIRIFGWQSTHVTLPSTPCSQIDTAQLWRNKRPTGFFYKGTWYLRHCKGGEDDEEFKQSLQNKVVYLMGDSTLRHWYQMTFIPRFECKPTTERWTKEQWHKPATCMNREMNLKIGWYPHSQPFFAGDDENTYTLYSIARRIDGISSEEHALVVIHLFMHIISYQQNAFITKMKAIRQSVEKLLRRNKHAQVFIKAPHSYIDTHSGDSRQNDFFGYVYINIMFDIFKGLHDKVIFLNNMDATDALQLKWNHPPGYVVNAMTTTKLTFQIRSRTCVTLVRGKKQHIL